MGPAIEAGLILSAETSNVYMRRLLAAGSLVNSSGPGTAEESSAGGIAANDELSLPARMSSGH
jgi:hypothetical protein